MADTNNHAIRVIDLENGNKVTTLAIDGLSPPTPPRPEIQHTFPNPRRFDLSPTEVKATGDTVTLSVSIDLPEGYKLNDAAAMGYLVEVEAGTNGVEHELR